LGDEDDITYFQFAKKNSREVGPVVVGLELKHPHDLEPIKQKMQQKGFQYQYLNDNADLFAQIIG
jgi:threonine dehydratase